MSRGIPFFRRAVEIDPKFAMAYANLGLDLQRYGESVLSAESTTKAWQLRDRVSDRERFFIDFTYDRQVTGNLEKAYQTLELWYQTYPRGERPPNPHEFVRRALPPMGRADLKERSRHPKKNRGRSRLFFGYGSLASSYFFLDRFPEAESTLQRASERKLESPDFLVMPIQHRGAKG